MWAGLIPGFLFGFLLKRSRMCLAGGLRDVYMEKRRSGLISMLLIIFTQSVVYFSLIRAGVLAMPEPKAFPLAATVIGGLLFGLGALIANGCITTTLVKVGDGRLAGFMSLFSFMIVGVASQKGFLRSLLTWILISPNFHSLFSISELSLKQLAIIFVSAAFPSIIIQIYKMVSSRYN